MRRTMMDLLSVYLRKGAGALTEPREWGAPSEQHTDPYVSPEKCQFSKKQTAARLLCVLQGNN